MTVYTLYDKPGGDRVAVSARLFESNQIVGYAVQQETDEATVAMLKQELASYRLVVSTHDEEAPFTGLSDSSCVLRRENGDGVLEIDPTCLAVRDGHFAGLILPGEFYYAKTEYGETVTKQHRRLIFLPAEGEEILISLHSSLTVYAHDGEESESSRRLYYRLERL